MVHGLSQVLIGTAKEAQTLKCIILLVSYTYTSSGRVQGLYSGESGEGRSPRQ